ncbi:MAG: hypothetical protein EXR75_10915 [Myxococcales bacterium]|nr:hypothetical protein [Myxococcales bacterium]
MGAALLAGAVGGCDVISGLSSIEAKPNGLTTGTAATGGDGGTAVTSSTGGTGGTGGTTSMSSAGGGGSSATAGGGGAAPECVDAGDCMATGTVCQLPVCTAEGSCEVEFAAKGTKCTDKGGVSCDGTGSCVALECLDNMKNGTETDVDCGGDTCKTKCANEKACDAGKDCKSGFCDANAPKDGEAGTCKPCAADGNCASGEFCSLVTSNCTKKLPNSGTCMGANMCASGFCADGYCCNAACDKACDSCAQLATLGTCSAALKYADGDPLCAPYLCDGTDASCPMACVGDADCVLIGFCRISNKECQPKKFDLTDVCEADNECLTGYCCSKLCAMMACP